MKRRLLYLSLHSSAPWQAGRTHVDDVVEALRARGWHVDVVAPGVAARSHPLRRLAEYLTLQLRATARLRRVDLLYVRHHPAAVLVAVAAAVAGVPRVEEVNGVLSDYVSAHPAARPLLPVLHACSAVLLRSASLIVTVTPALRDHLAGSLHRTRVPIAVVRNGASTTRFSPEAAGGPRLPQPYVCFVGALSPWQGVDTLLQATAHPGWPPAVRAVVIGDGALAATVRTAAAAGGAVRYLGVLSRDEVAGVLARAVASVSPKTAQAWHQSPLKVYESMASGVPLIVTDVGEQADLVRSSGCGVVVPPADPGALADAVASLAGQPATRASMGAAGHRAAVAEHSWAARALRLEALLDTVLTGRRGPVAS